MGAHKACPVCPRCGSKKFRRLAAKGRVRVECILCKKIIDM